MYVCLSELEKLTGVNRISIKKRLDQFAIEAKVGPNNRHLYQSEKVIPIIFFQWTQSQRTIPYQIMKASMLKLVEDTATPLTKELVISAIESAEREIEIADQTLKEKSHWYESVYADDQEENE